MAPGAAGERLFERYLDERGYGWEHEPDNLGTSKRPDYLVYIDKLPIACEVKAFNTAGILTSSPSPGRPSIGTRSMAEVLAPHRDDIKKAASQLKGLRDRGWPLVVVLSNPYRFPVPTDPKLVIAAMYGDPTMVASWRADDTLGEFRMVTGRNGRLANFHPYISAVAVLQVKAHARTWSEQWMATHRDHYADNVAALATAFLEAAQAEAPEGEDISLDVIETVSDKAIPLPRDCFAGPLDRRFAADETGAMIELPRDCDNFQSPSPRLLR